MAEGKGKPEAEGVVLILRQAHQKLVRVANAASGDLQQYLAGSWLGVWDLYDDGR